MPEKQKRVLSFEKAITEHLKHWNRKYGIDVGIFILE